MKLAILMRSDLNMRTGKMVAQGGHAAMMVGLSRFELGPDGNLHVSDEDVADLRGFLKYPDVEVSYAFTEEMLVEGTDDETDFHIVIDSGRTEFHGQLTMTCGASGIFQPKVDDNRPYGVSDSTPAMARQYLIMSRESSPLKQTAIAMAGIGCLAEIEKCLSQDPSSSSFRISHAEHPELFDWMGKGYPKIGLQVPNHEALSSLSSRMCSANVPHTLVDYQGCQMIVTAPGTPDKLKPLTGDLKLL